MICRLINNEIIVGCNPNFVVIYSNEEKQQVKIWCYIALL